MLKGSSILITGGTGSFGQELVARILRDLPAMQRVVVYSRDELKQHEMRQRFDERDYPAMRYFIGDVRDGARLRRAMEGIDLVVHAAAMKQVPAAEYNPFECIKTNVLGAQNVVEASLDAGVKRVVALSTDKAAAPINLYGATKLCSDKLFIAANNVRGSRDLRFSVVRYGNVMGSRGSVIPLFLKRRSSGVVEITDPAMTRFNISLAEGVDMVLWSLEHALGGEIFVPKIPSYRIGDLAEAIAPDCRRDIVGLRPGEKIHEEMVTESDSYNCLDLGDRFAILPASNQPLREAYLRRDGVTPVPAGFSYNSGTNDEFLSVEEIRAQLRQHLDCEL